MTHHAVAEKDRSCAVPLHQRLRALKSLGDGTAPSAAHTIFGCTERNDPWATAEVHEAAGEGARRQPSDERPLPPPLAELAHAAPSAGSAVLSMGEQRILCMCPGVGLREFTFDGVFGPKVRQRLCESWFISARVDPLLPQVATQELYADVADAPIVAFLNGKSSLIMAYGATGSGKTHTLHGPSSSSSCTIIPSSSSSKNDTKHHVHSLAGIAPRACAAVLTTLQRRRRIAAARGLPPPQLFCSYVQVYGNDVTDLLEGGGHQAIGAWAGVAAAAIAVELAT